MPTKHFSNPQKPSLLFSDMYIYIYMLCTYFIYIYIYIAPCSSSVCTVTGRRTTPPSGLCQKTLGCLLFIPTWPPLISPATYCTRMPRTPFVQNDATAHSHLFSRSDATLLTSAFLFREQHKKRRKFRSQTTLNMSDISLKQSARLWMTMDTNVCSFWFSFTE
jgi:hypothetical protein